MYWKERSCEQKLGNKFFLHFRQRNDSPENFVRQSLANITRVALPSHCLVKEKI